MNMNKKILFLALLGVILVPTICFAQTTTLQKIICNVQTALVATGGGLATIAFIVAGIMFLTATGNPSRMTIAKGALLAGVIGIVIIILAGSAGPFVSQIFFGANGPTLTKCE